MQRKIPVLFGFVLYSLPLFAGTTFFNSQSEGTYLFGSISSNGTVNNIDQSAIATYGWPSGMATDTNGNLYVAYAGDAIIRYTTNGASLFASNIGAPTFLVSDFQGNIYCNSSNSILKINNAGAISVYMASNIFGSYCFDRAGNFFGTASGQIIRLSPTGSSNIFAEISLNSLTTDGQGNLYGLQKSDYTASVYEYNSSGAFLQNFAIGGDFGTGQNIVADEYTNIISSRIYLHNLDIAGPFGIVDFQYNTAFYTYLAYSPINENLAVYAPTIILQPKSQTVAAGSTVNFRSGAVGSSPIYYQWYFGLTNSIPGATNQNLILTNITSNQSGQYSMVASNYLGTAISQPGNLSVLPSNNIVMVPTIIIYGGIGLTYEVQYVNSFGPTNAPWTTLATLVLTNSPEFYPDFSAIGQPSRFYQTVQLP